MNYTHKNKLYTSGISVAFLWHFCGISVAFSRFFYAKEMPKKCHRNATEMPTSAKRREKKKKKNANKDAHP